MHVSNEGIDTGLGFTGSIAIAGTPGAAHAMARALVAVLRRHTIGPEPLRFLMSLAVMPPLPANVSVAHLEMVSLLWTGMWRAFARCTSRAVRRPPPFRL